MSKCLSLWSAAFLYNNSSCVLLRLDLESFIKAGPSWQRGERIGCLRGWSGALEPKLWGNRWHHEFTWQVYGAEAQLCPSWLHYHHQSIQCPGVTRQGPFEIYLNLTFRKIGRFTSISRIFLKPSGQGWVGGGGRESCIGMILQTGTPVPLPAWIANSGCCFFFFFPSPKKDCYWSFPRLLLGILGWHRGEWDTAFCRDLAGISVWDEVWGNPS